MTTPQPPSGENRLPVIDEELLLEIRSEIVGSFEPDAIILIGSAARNETHAESDVDLVVVHTLEDDETTWEKARAIHRLFRGWRVPMDIVVVTPEEFRRGLKLPGHIAHTAGREGRKLYERSA